MKLFGQDYFSAGTLLQNGIAGSLFNVTVPTYVDSLVAYCGEPYSALKLRFMIYSSNDGNPDSLLAQTSIANIAIDTPLKYHVLVLDSPITLPIEQYYLAVAGLSEDNVWTVGIKTPATNFTSLKHLPPPGYDYVTVPPNPYPTLSVITTFDITCYANLLDLPVADFTATPLNGIYPLTVQFTDTSTNTPTSWLWSFGDGGASGEQNPSHQYTRPGVYTVSLTATNAAGSDTESKAGYITVLKKKVFIEAYKPTI